LELMDSQHPSIHTSYTMQTTKTRLIFEVRQQNLSYNETKRKVGE